MTWLAVLLVGIAVADLAHAVRPAPIVNEAIGASVAVWLGLLAGLVGPADLVALAVVAAVVMAWGRTVTQAFGGGRSAVPLLVLAGGVLLAVACSGLASTGGGALGLWLDGVDVPSLRGMGAERFLLLLAAFLLQLSTGNVLVRLVLAVTGTVSPALHDTPDDPEQRLKGGRLLGPMERVFIVGLGLAGQWTAASIVVAAKGLLRWPELRSFSEQRLIHQLTEYFLVGSFVSWLVALSSLALLAR